jgi:predicted DNA-binding protein
MIDRRIKELEQQIYINLTQKLGRTSRMSKQAVINISREVIEECIETEDLSLTVGNIEAAKNASGGFDVSFELAEPVFKMKVGVSK